MNNYLKFKLFQLGLRIELAQKLATVIFNMAEACTRDVTKVINTETDGRRYQQCVNF